MACRLGNTLCALSLPELTASHYCYKRRKEEEGGRANAKRKRAVVSEGMRTVM